MSREIKFRAWNKRKKEMFQIDLYGECLLSQDKDEVVMQYTGLLDKNGIEIYEGDIVSILDFEEEKKITSVRWEKEWASFELYKDYNHYGWFSDDVEISKCEVIGNIYENKEIS